MTGRADGKSGDAAPGLLEVSGIEPFHLWWARGVVAGDQVDDAGEQAFPQAVLVDFAANWRGALEERCAVGNIFGGEVQVVGAGLDGDGQALGACVGKQR